VNIKTYKGFEIGSATARNWHPSVANYGKFWACEVLCPFQYLRSDGTVRNGVVGFSAHNEPSGWFDSLVELELLIDKYQRATHRELTVKSRMKQ